MLPVSDLKSIKIKAGLTPYLSVIKHYRGAKRRIYEQAYRDLMAEGLHEKDSEVKAFVKVEKWTEQDKSPRMIQARDPKYVLALAHYLKNFEEEFYQSKHEGFRFVTKGLNRKQIADLFIEQVDSFKDPVCIMLDHSKFDSSVSLTMLRWEHKQYLRALPSRTLRNLLKKQERNICSVGKYGLRYTIKGTRMSGDYNTALGNTMINYALLERFVRGFRATMLVDGDDSVITVERTDLPNILSRRELFYGYGFNTKIETSEWADVEYCQCRLTEVRDGWYFLRNPAKILSNLQVLTQSYQGNAFKRYLAGVALGELHQVKGVPMLTEFLEELATAVPRNRIILDDKSRYQLTLPAVDLKCDASVFDCWDFDSSISPKAHPESMALLEIHALRSQTAPGIEIGEV